MSHEQDNSKTECDHYCHSCIHNITEEKDGLYYHKCRSKTERMTTGNSLAELYLQKM